MFPPPLPRDEATLRLAALARAARFARASAWVLLVLAGLSAALNVLSPFSGHFLISVLVLGNGFVELRLARQLARHDPRAPGRLALNQAALGVEILGYTAWRIVGFSPAEIVALLERPVMRPLIDALPSDSVSVFVEQLPTFVIVVIAVIGVVTAAGCGAVAWYYRSRRKFLPVAA